jgi:hypothetical protein
MNSVSEMRKRFHPSSLFSMWCLDVRLVDMTNNDEFVVEVSPRPMFVCARSERFSENVQQYNRPLIDSRGEKIRKTSFSSFGTTLQENNEGHLSAVLSI